MPVPVTAAPKRWGSAAEMAALEEAYARDVELRNGRWAMVGFALAVWLESFTGLGVVGQLELYGKLSGVLGAESGF